MSSSPLVNRPQTESNSVSSDSTTFSRPNGSVPGNGQSFPLGATLMHGGVNFSIYSTTCQRLELLLFDDVNDKAPSRVIPLSHMGDNRTFHYWHIFVPELQSGQLYGYRAYGPFDPANGLRFDGTKVLLDPYGRSVAIPSDYDRDAAVDPGDNAATAMKSVVADLDQYDWENDERPRHPFSKTVIYEMHVRGFTAHASSGVAKEKRGTYAGLVEKIPYLQDLGVTAVELLPVFQFDPQEAPPGLTNYWGYNPVSFFAPHSAYSSASNPLAVLDEFRDMVKALHRAGIEVILDVVYNHTTEGNEDGPTLCFKGFDNDAYYILDQDRSRYANYSGTGNTLNANHAVVRRMICDSLRFWVEQMHIDGFRFDLASVLSRDPDGRPLHRPPILWDIETDPVLSDTKLIAEAWDAAGLYQVGNFFGDRWKEWNGKFRDDVRAFLKGDPGFASRMASRFLASPDIYGHRNREAEQSINFVTCHDGFTLNDVVSYNEKHNEANLEGSRDGHNENLSWNCGVEGPSTDPEIESLRLRQIKNLAAINLLALGVPMVLMGDEMRRSQLGNNNAYCQDNELNWLDWKLLDSNQELHRFFKLLMEFRRGIPDFDDANLSLNELIAAASIQWHGIKLHAPDWSDRSHSIAFSLMGPRYQYHLIVNAYWDSLTFELPPSGGRSEIRPWRRLIDTSLPSPQDICLPGQAKAVSGDTYQVEERSFVMLLTDRPGRKRR